MSEYKNPDYSPPRSEDELIQRYQKGERYFGETELDKETIDFREACLEDIIFTPRSFLTADFRNAKLMGADFSDCNLKTCDFRGADLRNARFNGAAIDATRSRCSCCHDTIRFIDSAQSRNDEMGNR